MQYIDVATVAWSFGFGFVIGALVGFYIAAKKILKKLKGIPNGNLP